MEELYCSYIHIFFQVVFVVVCVSVATTDFILRCLVSFNGEGGFNKAKQKVQLASWYSHLVLTTLNLLVFVQNAVEFPIMQLTVGHMNDAL
jgi:hypothetical protein